MTPREIHWAIEAHRSREAIRQRHGIWLAHLMACAYHDPRHLPPVPPHPAPSTMTDAQMKQQLLHLCRKEPHDP